MSDSAKYAIFFYFRSLNGIQELLGGINLAMHIEGINMSYILFYES